MTAEEIDTAVKTWQRCHAEIEALEEEAEAAVRPIEKIAAKILDGEMTRSGQWPKLDHVTNTGVGLRFYISNGRDLHNDFESYVSIHQIEKGHE